MIKKFEEFVNESIFDGYDGWKTTSTHEVRTPLPRKEVFKLREQFKDISNCVTAIINKDEKEIKELLWKKRGMIVCSMAGARLTHSIEDAILKSNGTEEDVLTIPDDTKITESILYEFLYKYNNKLIVIEDFEKILNNPRCYSMLKYAMSERETEREIYSPNPSIEDDIPTQFTFNGYIMLTSRTRLEELIKKYSLNSIIHRCEVFNIFPDEEFKNTYIDRKRNY